MSSNFERALTRQEIPQFFRGQGEYLTRDGDWDEHLFCINWPGIFAYMRDNADGEQQLSASFELYVYSIEESFEDCFGLRENLFGYYSTRARWAPASTDLLAQLPAPCRRRIVQRLSWYRWQLENHARLLPERARRMAEDGAAAEFIDLPASPYA
ncbi:hypothetical protein [Pseudomonas chlororaphis]|uniref:hypothetical protein n=1 Tax=Pseudomonas chlororaphis TaxID=587753 RepID=UPI0019261C79|nr:hypothetical protein [Pseudomonas chlororaphis]QQX59141.1 hypothetical protein JHW28_00950 [Pseudomonas chlororaphis subsp. aurantiaca]